MFGMDQQGDAHTRVELPAIYNLLRNLHGTYQIPYQVQSDSCKIRP